jgi:mono/diheme cytochrome c family protein
MKSANILSISGILSVLLFFLQSQSLAHSWMAPENAAKKRNPIQITDESTYNGQILFIDLCSFCHGLGAVGLSKEKTGLKKDTPNLSNRLKTHSDGDFHWKILNGKGDMPSFKDELSEKEVWDVINYIKTLIKK